jgi:phosphatidylglycerol lysyltransferase
MKCETPIVSPNYEHYRSQAEMPLELIDRLRQCAREFGDTYASYLATQSDREYFWASGRCGVVAFLRLGRYVNVADGLLAKPADCERLLAEFLAFAEQNNWVVSFINVPRNEIKMYRRHGCQVTKCGEEPLVQLDRTDWQGKDSQWLRRQENYCKRRGVEVCEVNPDSTDPAYRDEVVPQLEEISRDHISMTLHRREMQFYVSHFSAHKLNGRRLFVARQGSLIIAFIVCNPGLDGDFWAVEVYRRRKDAVRGVIPFVIMHAMRLMKTEGVRYFSLSLAPFLRCNAIIDDSPVFRFVANSWWRYLNPIYDAQGIFHFKSRFRPDYREMYLATKPGVTIRSLLVIAYIWKLFHFNPLRLLKRSMHRRRTTKHHSLAVPEQRSKRVIRRLRHKQDRNDAVASQLPVTPVYKQENAKIHSREDISL